MHFWQAVSYTHLYEAAQLLVADKPAGLLVSDEEGGEADTLLNRALRHLAESGDWEPQDAFTPCLCHRLDAGTSGLVMIAKTPFCRDAVLEAMRLRQFKKTYLGVTFGRPAPSSGTLRGYLSKDAARGLVRVTSAPRPRAVSYTHLLILMAPTRDRPHGRKIAAARLFFIDTTHFL